MLRYLSLHSFREKKTLAFHLPCGLFVSGARLIAILVCQNKAAAKQVFMEVSVVGVGTCERRTTGERKKKKRNK